MSGAISVESLPGPRYETRTLFGAEVDIKLIEDIPVLILPPRWLSGRELAQVELNMDGVTDHMRHSYFHTILHPDYDPDIHGAGEADYLW